MSDQLDTLILTSNEIEAIYEELSNMSVDLDTDPLAFGPKRLNSKVAETRTILTRCEQIFMETSRRMHLCTREHRRLEAILSLKKKNLISNDPEVRAGRSITDRDSLASIKLQTDVEEVDKWSQAVQDLETILTVVKAKRADIKDIQGRLKDQLNLCLQELGLGAAWGSRMFPTQNLTQETRKPVERVLEPDSGMGSLMEQAEQLLNSVVPVKALPTTQVPAELSDQADASEVDSFLDSFTVADVTDAMVLDDDLSVLSL